MKTLKEGLFFVGGGWTVMTVLLLVATIHDQNFNFIDRLLIAAFFGLFAGTLSGLIVWLAFISVRRRHQRNREFWNSMRELEQQIKGR